MRFMEITALEQLSPQDYLLYMQGVWAQIVEITPVQLGVEPVFHEFSEILNELEAVVVCKKEEENIISDDAPLLTVRNKMDDTYLKLMREIHEMDNSALFTSLDSLT